MCFSAAKRWQHGLWRTARAHGSSTNARRRPPTQSLPVGWSAELMAGGCADVCQACGLAFYMPADSATHRSKRGSCQFVRPPLVHSDGRYNSPCGITRAPTRHSFTHTHLQAQAGNHHPSPDRRRRCCRCCSCCCSAHLVASAGRPSGAAPKPLAQPTTRSPMASSSRKRARTSFASEDSLISIRLAEGGGAALAADRHLLLAVSECARGLPGDAAEWDLSGLLIEGQPVSRAVVVAWLHTVVQHTYEEPFAGEAQQAPPLNCSAAGLAQLLAFADAVGSSRGVLRACLPPLEQLQFRLQAGEQAVQLDVGGAYSWDGDEDLKLTKQGRDQKVKSEEEVFTAASDAAKAQLSQQFARQLEALLYLAHRLELDSLAQALHTCVRYNTAWKESLLSDEDSPVNPRVLSARVLEAAAGPGQLGQLAFINSVLTQPASFIPGPGRRQVLEPLDLSAAQKQPLKFSARLTEDFLGAGSKGQVVDVQLDLFGQGAIKVGSAGHIAQLLVGPPISDEAFGKLAAAHQEQAAAAVE